MDGFIDPLLIRNDYLLQSHTRCPAASRWRGGTQSALDSWGKGSPPAGGRSREHLHPTSWRQSPPEHVQKRKQRNALQNSDSWGVCVLVWAHLQHAGAFSLDGATRRHIQFIHLLLTADKEFNQLVNNPLQLVSFFFCKTSTVLQCLIFTISRFGRQCRQGNASQMSPVHPVWFLQTDVRWHPHTASSELLREEADCRDAWKFASFADVVVNRGFSTDSLSSVTTWK